MHKKISEKINELRKKIYASNLKNAGCNIVNFCDTINLIYSYLSNHLRSTIDYFKELGKSLKEELKGQFTDEINNEINNFKESIINEINSNQNIIDFSDDKDEEKRKNVDLNS